VLINGRRLINSPGDPRTAPPAAGQPSRPRLADINFIRLIRAIPALPDINFIPALAVEPHRRADRRRLVGLRRGRRRGRRQLHHGHGLRGHPPRRPVQLLRHVNNETRAASARATSLAASSSANGHRADGGTVDASMVIGAGFDDGRGHVTAYATYRKQNQVLQRDRDYSFCSAAALNAAQSTALGRLFNCGGSATSANGTFFTNVGNFQVGPNRTFIPGSTPFNFAPYNFFQRPDERYTFGAFANYEISDSLKPYPRGDVHGRPLGRPDRSVGRLLQHHDDQLRQPFALRSAACDRLLAGEPGEQQPRPRAGRVHRPERQPL
jgi:hypothetical protein